MPEMSKTHTHTHTARKGCGVLGVRWGPGTATRLACHKRWRGTLSILFDNLEWKWLCTRSKRTPDPDQNRRWAWRRRLINDNKEPVQKKKVYYALNLKPASLSIPTPVLRFFSLRFFQLASAPIPRKDPQPWRWASHRISSHRSALE